MIEIGQVRIWHNGNGRFTILEIKEDSADWKYLGKVAIWTDRISYILTHSEELSPVLKELYE